MGRKATTCPPRTTASTMPRGRIWWLRRWWRSSEGVPAQCQPCTHKASQEAGAA